MTVVISNEAAIKTLDLLKKLLEDQKLQRYLVDNNETIDLSPAIDLAFPNDNNEAAGNPYVNEPAQAPDFCEIRVEDDEEPDQIVQKYDSTLNFEGFEFPNDVWVDTFIDPEEIDHYREQFPEEEYRLVSVTNPHPYPDDSVDEGNQQGQHVFDETNDLKARVLELEARLAQNGIDY